MAKVEPLRGATFPKGGFGLWVTHGVRMLVDLILCNDGLFSVMGLWDIGEVGCGGDFEVLFNAAFLTLHAASGGC